MLETLLFVMATISVLYYQMIFMLKAGLHVAIVLTQKADLKDSFLSNGINWTAFLTLFWSEYQLYSIFFLPWLILSSITLVFGLLIYLEFIEVRDNEDEG
jgi:hypothetical protein